MSLLVDGLALRTTVRQLVATWQSAEQAIRDGFAQIDAAQEALNAVYTLGGNGTLRVTGRSRSFDLNFSDPSDALDYLARGCWRHIVDRLELRRVLSDFKWTELQRNLEKGKLPPITEETVHTFAAQYMTALGDLFQEKVAEVFERIRPREGTRRAEYKTNARNATYEIGERVILAYIVEPNWDKSKLTVRHSSHPQLTALESVFRALDGQGYGTQHHYSDLATAINASATGVAETEYFKASFFKNGNLHLTFRRADLLAEFNRIAGGLRIKEAV
jgi:Domain of unknown function (DUF4942)